jgi:hypothetical protein
MNISELLSISESPRILPPQEWAFSVFILKSGFFENKIAF